MIIESFAVICRGDGVIPGRCTCRAAYPRVRTDPCGCATHASTSSAIMSAGLLQSRARAQQPRGPLRIKAKSAAGKLLSVAMPIRAVATREIDESALRVDDQSVLDLVSDLEQALRGE